MFKKLVCAAMLLGVVDTNAQEDVSLTIGRLVYFNEIATQNFTAKTTRPKPLGVSMLIAVSSAKVN
jgi:hypothetical protein